MKTPKTLWSLSGVLLCVAVAVLSFLTWRLLPTVSPLMWAFVYSLVITNAVKLPQGFGSGIAISSTKILKIALCLLGLTISATVWLTVGIAGLAIALIVVFLGFVLGVGLGKRFGLSSALSTLIGIGTSICGASAIAATGPAINAKEEEMGVALACVTLFGLGAMFLYPFLYSSTIVGAWLGHNDVAFGVWAGTGIHETAQVVAASSMISAEALEAATLVKSIRIFMIGPMVLISSLIYGRLENQGKSAKRITVPLFAVVLILNTFINTALQAFPPTASVWSTIALPILKTWVVPFVLAWAFAGVGFKVKLGNIRKLGLRAFGLGVTVAVTTSIVSLLLTALLA
ncbi:MAG TPA: putative sulfate exporter family transporter [Candidatus Bathyarchaeia archaeon]|nr:putative sulfate exporter family transporter [Candidatus Bathyarchaeia archaeon]